MDANDISVKEEVSASLKLKSDDAMELALKASSVHVFKGKNTTTFKGGKNLSPDNIKSMLGPTGNLRAPTIVLGKTVLVGFNEEEFVKLFK